MNIASLIQPAKGNQSVDLSGNGPGSVAQVVPTVAGAHYIVRWAMAGNMDCGQALKEMLVTVGSHSKMYKFNTKHHTLLSMGWKYHQLKLKASGPTTISFADVTPDHSICGATLDDVSVASS